MSDREESPDWLREFQAPAQNIVTLSSSSDSSPKASPRGSDDSDHTCYEEPETKEEKQVAVLTDSGEDSPVVKAKKTKSMKTQKRNGDILDAQDEELAEEDTRDIPSGPPASSRLPLVFPDKVNRSKALIECDGDSIDLSGDVGAVGRIVILNGSASNNEMLLDLKGTIYKSTIVPSRTFCIVSVGQEEAKIEAIMNDFIKLEPQSNVFEAETMIEGTLEGFSFDSDEEGDKMTKPSGHQDDQNNENGDQANSKTKRKVERSSGVAKRKAKAAVRQSKTVKKTKKSKK